MAKKNGSSDYVVKIPFSKDTANWHKYIIPAKVPFLIGKNQKDKDGGLYTPKDEKPPKRIIFELGTLEENL